MILAVAALLAAPSAYLQQEAAWRRDYAERLRAERGWLSVAGLYWLREGEQTVGAGVGNDVRLPSHGAPDLLGTFVRRGNDVTLRAAEGGTLRVNGGEVRASELRLDTSGTPDQVTVGDLSFNAIQRGKRIGIRLYDRKAEELLAFRGLRWFPVDPRYRVTADFVPYRPAHSVPIRNVLGDVQSTPCPGYVVFKIGGKRCRLEALGGGDGLFLNFQDATTSEKTYPAGRFLDTAAPKDGKVVIDFNRATNPPCAYTEYATCPLPPFGNRLKAAISAGEKDYPTVHRALGR